MKTEATRMGQGIQEGVGRNLTATEARVEVDAGAHSWTNAEPNTRMEQVLERPNLMRAYQRVVSNKGAAGVDQMPVIALKGHLQQHWPIGQRCGSGCWSEITFPNRYAGSVSPSRKAAPCRPCSPTYS